MDDAEWDGLFLFDQRALQVVRFELPGEAPVQSGVGLGVGRLPWVVEAIQEVGPRNCPPCLGKRLFPKSIHLALGVLGLSDSVSMYIQDFNSRER